MQSKIHILSASSLALLTACSSISGGPKSSYEQGRDLSELAVEITYGQDNARLKQLLEADTVSASARNNFLSVRMAEIDDLYFEYERKLSNDIRNGNFGFGLAGSVIGTLGTVSSSATSKELSALSAVLSGGKSAFDKDILLSQNISAMILQMRADRADVKKRIIGKFGASASEYTIQMALPELEDYYRSGTMSSALAGIVESASKRESESVQELQNVEAQVIEIVASSTSELINNLADWIEEPASEEGKSARQNAVKACFESVDKSGLGANSSLQFSVWLAQADLFPQFENHIKTCLVSSGFGA